MQTSQQDTGMREQGKFQTLFENSTIGIIVANTAGEITLVNHFAEEQFGYSKDELIGSKIEKLIPSDVRERHVKHREKFVEEMHTRPMGIGMDLFALRKDGTKFPVEISLSHFTTYEGTFAIAFVNDITIRKKNEEAILKQQEILKKYSDEVRLLNEQLEQRVEDRTLALREAMQQLEKSKDELEQALGKEKELSDLKSRFVSMASHEFRTPLSSILSSAVLIEKYPGGDQQDKRQKHIHRIKENVKNLADILEDFLSLGKLEEGLIKPKPELVNIPVFVNEVVHDMNEIKRHEQKISFTHIGKPEFECDKHLLRNILINLLSNAIKFSNDGGEVEVRTETLKNKFTLSVCDYGIGISREDQEHLFDRFFRGKNAMNIKGTGLGLHIVSKYLELINGSIECSSELNEGTEFIITIPQPKS